MSHKEALEKIIENLSGWEDTGTMMDIALKNARKALSESAAEKGWLEYIDQFPKLKEIWMLIKEPTNTYLRQQIDIFSGKYPQKSK